MWAREAERGEYPPPPPDVRKSDPLQANSLFSTVHPSNWMVAESG